MRWLVFAIFAVTFVSSLLWIDAKERKFTAPQQTLLAAATMIGWAIVLLLGYLVV